MAYFVHLCMKNFFLPVLLLALLASCNGHKDEHKTHNPLDNPATDASTTGLQKIGPDKYEILSTHHNTTMKNYHVLLVDPKIDSAYLQNFADQFRRKYCEIECNIMLYDDRAVTPFVMQYPLPDSQYVRLADHFIAASAAQQTAIKLYPFKDDRYRKLKPQPLK